MSIAFAEQARFEVAPVTPLAVACPMGQLVACDSPAEATYVSAGAFTHAVAPVVGEYVPTRQGCTNVEPEDATKYPLGADVQVIAPTSEENVPAGQRFADIEPTDAT